MQGVEVDKLSVVVQIGLQWLELDGIVGWMMVGWYI